MRAAGLEHLVEVWVRREVGRGCAGGQRSVCGDGGAGTFVFCGR